MVALLDVARHVALLAADPGDAWMCPLLGFVGFLGSHVYAFLGAVSACNLNRTLDEFKLVWIAPFVVADAAVLGKFASRFLSESTPAKG